MNSLFLNERRPPYMESTEHITLTLEQIRHAVLSMSFSGRTVAAAAAILLLNRQGLSPAQILDVLDGKEEVQK